MYPAALAFVDLETTGTHAGGDRITEIGIVRVDAGGCGTPRVTEWSSLVNPEVPIPAPIQVLTGITDAMVGEAPRFRHVAADVARLLEGCIFVAHNARFDAEGAEPVGSAPDANAAQIVAERGKWARLIASAGIKED
jgi:DNA polymerase-3 subunit epsilon